MRNRYIRLAVSLAAAMAVSFLLVVSTGEKQTVYRPVVMVTRDIEPNTPLTSQNLAVKDIPAETVPAEALQAIPQGKVAGQKLWTGEFLLSPMVKDNPIALPVPDHRVFSIPVSLKAVGGIQPGDRVDVLLFSEDKASHGSGESRVILSGITVVDILNQKGQALAGKEDKVMGSAAVPAVAEVLVTAAQANLLNAAANTGTIALARYLPDSQPVTDVPAVVVNGGDVQW
ncbi:hypothetical protein SY88_00385 [Clostridiales bacterium PH28_bin88]|nr:hypothetical protein SY88_00385 [Clostridiales bacterium PH28_bin88]